MKLRNYNQESGDYEFFIPLTPIIGETPLDNEQNAYISIAFNAGSPNHEKIQYPQKGIRIPFQTFAHGIIGATVTFKGFDPVQNKVTTWKSIFEPLVEAILIRCRKSAKFSKKSEGAKRTTDKILSVNRENGTLFFSLPCAEDESAGIEIILSLPQGLELFVAGEKKLSFIPSNARTLPQNDGILQFKTWNTKTGHQTCAEVSLTEFLQNIARQNLDEVDGEIADSVNRSINSEILHNILEIEEVSRNPENEHVGAIWHFYKPFLNSRFTFLFGGKKYNKKISFKLNMLLAWICTRSQGLGITKKISNQR